MKEIQRETRNEQLVKLKNLLANLSIDLSATWHEAKPKFEGHPLFSTLTHLNAVDTLTAFEDHMTDLEKQFKDNLERQKMLYKRQERKRRTAFKNLLDRLVKENKLKVYTKWKDILPELEEEKAFLHMVGQSGSTPLDLFRDVIIRFEEDVKDKLIAIERIVMQNHIKVLPKTTFEEFEQSVNSHGVFFDEDALRVAFDRLMAESLAIEKEEKRREERRLRRSMDDFKSVLKRASPPITLKTPWVEAAALVSHKPEYSDLAEEHRLPVFEKYISRLAEKAKDEGSEDGEEGMIISDDEKRRKSSKKEKKKHRRRRSESPSSEDEERKSKKKVSRSA